MLRHWGGEVASLMAGPGRDLSAAQSQSHQHAYPVIPMKVPSNDEAIGTRAEIDVADDLVVTRAHSESSIGAEVPPSTLRLLQDKGVLLDAGTLEALPVQVWVATADKGELKSLYANSRWASFRGIAPGSMPMSAWRSSVHPEDAATTAANWKHALETGTTYKNVLRMRRAEDGAYVWFRGEACPLKDSKGAIVAYVGVT